MLFPISLPPSHIQLCSANLHLGKQSTQGHSGRDDDCSGLQDARIQRCKQDQENHNEALN
jgi:hypothetical protein